MTDQSTLDTLQGLMKDGDALSFIATLGGTEYEIGLGYVLPGDKTTIYINSLAYAIRRVRIWKPIGSTVQSEPFPFVAFSSINKHFFVLDEKLSRNDKRAPLAVESVRPLTLEELVGDSFRLGDDELLRLLAS